MDISRIANRTVYVANRDNEQYIKMYLKHKMILYIPHYKAP